MRGRFAARRGFGRVSRSYMCKRIVCAIWIITFTLHFTRVRDMKFFKEECILYAILKFPYFFLQSSLNLDFNIKSLRSPQVYFKLDESYFYLLFKFFFK